MKKTIVVSAVNLKVGGTLTILRECLTYLSALAKKEEYRVVALVHKKDIAYFDNIEYIELSWSKKNWINRIWCEYVTMKRISKLLSPVYLWLSLHDTTPNVCAKKRVVYCHNSFPFYLWKWRDWLFNYKIVLFAWFSYFIYRINIYENDYVVLQQQWIRNEFIRMFHLSKDKIIVAPPQTMKFPFADTRNISHKEVCFFFPSSPDVHKNFETLCQASEWLENEVGIGVFKTVITVNGKENKYAAWLKKKWGHVKSIYYVGFLDRDNLCRYYESADCLIFSSKIETWGLPISEFMQTDKPMLLADLPYAHETSAGASRVAFFSATNAVALKNEMRYIVNGDYSRLKQVPKRTLEEPSAYSWDELFNMILN